MLERIFLFPIPNTVLMKGTSLPFHIFEPKYLQMTEAALNEKTPVAVSYSRSNGEYLDQICVGGPLNLVQDNPNGTKLVIINGQSKYRLVELIQEKPFRIFNAQKIEEIPTISTTSREDLEAIKLYFKQWTIRNVPTESESEKIFAMMDNDEQLISYSTLFLLKDVHEKQEILEAKSFEAKIELIKKCLLPNEIKLGEFLPPLKLRD
jgi:Lon protease-like protein